LTLLFTSAYLLLTAVSLILLCSALVLRKKGHLTTLEKVGIVVGKVLGVIGMEYMVGRSSGKYLASHPSWFRKEKGSHRNSSYLFENRVTPETTSSFRPETLLQPYPLPAALPNPQKPTIHQLQKLEELKILLGKFSSPENAHVILELAKYNLRQGDEQFLNERLEQLRTLNFS
jgi:hypothetical protein